MAEIAYPLEPSGSVDFERHPHLSPEKNLSKVPFPKNEFGIILPPEVQGCRGEECRFHDHAAAESCDIDTHHLLGTNDFYLEAGDEAFKFKNLRYLTVWLHKCRHTEHHERHYFDSPVPEPEIIQAVTEEAAILDKVNLNYLKVRNLNTSLYMPDITKAGTLRVLGNIDKLVNERGDYLRAINAIRIIPEELVTGALLAAAPKLAQGRIHNGSKFVLTGSLLKEEVPAALNFGNESVVKKAAEDLGVAVLHFSEVEFDLNVMGPDASGDEIELYVQERQRFQVRSRELAERMSALSIISPAVITTALLEMGTPTEEWRDVSLGLNEELISRIKSRWRKEDRRKQRRLGLVA